MRAAKRSIFALALAAGAGVTTATTPPPEPTGDWRGYTPATIRAAVPRAVTGGTVEVVPLRRLTTLSSATYFELRDALTRTRPGTEPEAVLLGPGVYDLERLTGLLDDPGLLAMVSPQRFLLRRPLYLAPGATLVLEGVELRLSIAEMAVVLYRGDLFAVDARITSWDEARGDPGPRAEIPKHELLLHGQHPARPYLLGLRGSRSFFAASSISGLGFNGTLAGFGVSLYARHPEPGAPGELRDLAGALPRPTAVLIGNTISDCFFGFYTNNSGAVLLLGNMFRDNVVYNVDPRDYSGPLVIVRNVATGAKFKHGIILSRQVNGALIHENLSFRNGGTGIMLDRASEDAEIAGNVVFDNRGDGIASFESDRGVITANVVFGNRNNGVYLRNSAAVTVTDNTIDHNGLFGIEVASADLDATATRDFELDPYQQRGDVRVTGNTLRANLDAAVAAKGEVGLLIRGNEFEGSGPQFFAGDLREASRAVLGGNAGAGYRHAGAAP